MEKGATRAAILIILLVSVAFIIAGCGTTPSTRPASINPRTGTQGLVLRFVQGNPPTSIFVGDPFSIQIQVDNMGAFPQDPGSGSPGSDPDSRGDFALGTVFLEGFDIPTVFTFDNAVTNLNVPGIALPPTLYGKDQYNAKGTSDYITFNGRVVSLPHGDTVFNQKFQATVCYAYRTIALATLCMDGDPFRTQVKSKVCQWDQVSDLNKGQGGPVAVTYIRPEIASSQIRYEIGLTNAGGGLLLQPHAMCPNADYREVNYVHVTVWVNNQDITSTCKPRDERGYVRLLDGKGTINCAAVKPDKSIPAYLAPIKIVIDYDYASTIQGQMRVLPQ